MDRPDISVVIPTYNRKEYLRQAIASCFDGNDGLDIEVIVVDDGSSDGTRDYLNSLDDPRVRPFLQEHQGGQVARNRGLIEARGEFVKFLDDDDWLPEGGLATEAALLRESEADLCYGAIHFVDEDGNFVESSSQEASKDLVADLLDGTVTTHPPSKFTYRRNLAANHRWQLDLPVRQDLDFVLSVAVEEPTHASTDTLVGYMRWHDGARVSDSGAENTDTVRLHIRLLLRAVQRLHEKNKLTPKRKRAAATGLWRWAHMLAAHDWQAFEDVYRKIESLVPGCLPERPSVLLWGLDQLFGPYGTERVLLPLRSLVDTT